MDALKGKCPLDQPDLNLHTSITEKMDIFGNTARLNDAAIRVLFDYYPPVT